MSGYCRFELLLPLPFNDGTSVPKALLAGAVTKIENQFGVAAGKSQVIEGIWRQGGSEYRDKRNRVFVDAEDIPANRRFFVDLKSRRKSNFPQLDIWLTVHPIKVL